MAIFNPLISGTPDSRTQWQMLTCGPLTLHLDPETVSLRNIRLGETEIVRSIYVAVRDRNWNTVAPEISSLNIETENNGFRVSVVVSCRQDDIDFVWQGEITGEPDGTIRFSMDGRAQTTFLRNRIGFCVLHPIRECAGQPCTIETVDGATVETAFSDLIAPHQPFLNLRAITHQVALDVRATVRMEGETFETEDQRNWTDASFKTYGTPLALPYPVEIAAGTRSEQTVTLTLTMEKTGDKKRKIGANVPNIEPSMPKTDVVSLRLNAKATESLPPIGLGVASHGRPLTDHEISLLRPLNLSHLRLDLNLSEPDWKARLQQAKQEARVLDCRLELALFLSANADAELGELADMLPRSEPPAFTRLLVFPAGKKVTPPELAKKALLDASQAYIRNVTAGTDAYFAELNRERPPSDNIFDLCYSLNPQVHAFDTASLVENLEAQGETVRSARAFSNGKGTIVSPVTLKPRFNPNATGAETAPRPDELPPQVDVRQMSLFGAGWTLGSIAALCEADVRSLTYYETTGWRGVMEREAGSPLPEAFPSIPGQVFPMWFVFADIGSFRSGAVLPVASSASNRVVGMALRGGTETALLCANLTPETQTVRLELPENVTSLARRQLDADTLETYLREPEAWVRPEPNEKNAIPIVNGIAELTLPPYAYARLDWKTPE